MLKHKLAFLANHKTGTTSLESALKGRSEIIMWRPAKVKHMTAETFETVIRPYLDEIGETNVKTFAVMRDPIDQMKSWYFYRRRIDGTGNTDLRRSTRDVTWPNLSKPVCLPTRPSLPIFAGSRSFWAATTAVIQKSTTFFRSRKCLT